MNRGELSTVAGGSDSLPKPHPVFIIQSKQHWTADSITVCPLSTHVPSIPLFRSRTEPSEENGLLAPSLARGDMITTVRRSRMGRRIGHLGTGDLARLEVAVAEFLGLALKQR